MATVKGKWVFNQIISHPGFSPSYHIPVVFSNAPYGTWTYTSEYVYFESYLFRWCAAASTTGSSSIFVAYDYNEDKWNLDGYRNIDFGSTEQEVPEDFYSWFIANAKPYVPPIGFDLSTLNLTGTHSITVKARGTGYIASPASNAVEYTA